MMVGMKIGEYSHLLTSANVWKPKEIMQLSDLEIMNKVSTCVNMKN